MDRHWFVHAPVAQAAGKQAQVAGRQAQAVLWLQGRSGLCGEACLRQCAGGCDSFCSTVMQGRHRQCCVCKAFRVGILDWLPSPVR